MSTSDPQDPTTAAIPPVPDEDVTGAVDSATSAARSEPGVPAPAVGGPAVPPAPAPATAPPAPPAPAPVAPVAPPAAPVMPSAAPVTPGAAPVTPGAAPAAPVRTGPPPVAPTPPAPSSATPPPFTALPVTPDDESARHAAGRPTPLPPDPAPSPRFTTAAPLGAGGRSEAPADEPVVTPPPPLGKSAGPIVDPVAAPAVAGAGIASSRHEATATPAPLVAAGALAATGGAHAAGTAGAAAAAAPATPLTPTPGTPGARAAALADPALFPDPNAPRTITFGTHVLGVLVGLVLPAVAVLITLLGNSRILVVQADGWVAGIDVLGIVLLTLGVLLLAGAALLCLWAPGVGFVGGTLLTLAGAFALYAPGLTRQAVLDAVSSESWRPAVVQTVVSATSGVLLVAGVMLLCAGIVSSAARRHGLQLGAFRERHRNP